MVRSLFFHRSIPVHWHLIIVRELILYWDVEVLVVVQYSSDQCFAVAEVLLWPIVWADWMMMMNR
jgi:hypothetical protein